MSTTATMPSSATLAELADTDYHLDELYRAGADMNYSRRMFDIIAELDELPADTVAFIAPLRKTIDDAGAALGRLAARLDSVGGCTGASPEPSPNVPRYCYLHDPAIADEDKVQTLCHCWDHLDDEWGDPR